MANDNSSKDETATIYIVFLLCIFLWVVFGLAPAVRAYCLPEPHGKQMKPLEEAGTFGDSFGMVNSLAGMLGMAGVVLTLYLQRKELSESSKSAIESRNHTARMTLLASLVNARAAQVQSAQLRYNSDLGEYRTLEQSRGPVIAEAYARRTRDESRDVLSGYLLELQQLVNYAEHESGWAAEKVRYRPRPGFGEEPAYPAI